MYDLPTQIQIGEQIIPIRCKGDFRMVLDCFSALNDEELDHDDCVLSALIIFYEGVNEDTLDSIFSTPELLNEAVEKMYDFFNCNSVVVDTGDHSKRIDWEQDEQLIVSAINNVAKKEIRLEKYVHLFTFMGYYMSVGESALATVVSIRDKILRGKKLEKYEQEFRARNPQYFKWNKKSAEDKRLENEIMAIWNHNSGR